MKEKERKQKEKDKGMFSSQGNNTIELSPS
jgi:hypothetical protein